MELEQQNLQTEQQSVSQQNNVNDSIDYIEAIKEIKQNTVPRSSYEELQQKNKDLLQALIDGKQVAIEQEQEEKVDIAELRKALFSDDSELSNLEFVTKAMQLRTALIESGEPDPFLPWGNKISPTDEDVKMAEKVAEVFNHCIEYADGNSEVFTNELQRLTIDNMPRRNNYNRR